MCVCVYTGTFCWKIKGLKLYPRVYFIGSNHYFLFSIGSVYLSEPLCKFQRNLSGQTFEMENYLLIKFCQTDFFTCLALWKHHVNL